MQKLNDAIRSLGVGIGSDIVKVDMFLNHRIDTALLSEMGKEIARHFEQKKPDIVLTVEASGIALAVMAALHLGGIPVVFAKKAKAVNQGDGMLTAPVYSFTHKTENLIRVDPKYLPKGARVLVADDFLANGQAAEGLINLCEKAGCTLVGVAVAVEKGFQPGGRELREKGVDVLSLAVVTGIENGVIRLAENESSIHQK